VGLRRLLSVFRRPFVPETPRPASITVSDRRLIVRPDMLPGDDGDNINVPSMIRVPDWVERPLGRYFLYFGSHERWRHIRLAIADDVGGPWRIHPQGTLAAADVPGTRGWVAAPDVHVDHDARQIRMYFHGRSNRHRRAKAMVGISTDGLGFRVGPHALGGFYFRAFRYRGEWFAMSKGGRLYRSPDGLSAFTRGGDAFPIVPGNGSRYNATGSIRHVAFDVIGDRADVFYSRIGDAPERILKSPIDLTRPWRRWKAGPPEEVIRPQAPWEGADEALAPSKSGRAKAAACELRDPAIFRDEDGKRYLLYVVAGERGIAIAQM
jgi:hypothetical protein